MAHDPWQHWLQWQQFASRWGAAGPKAREPGFTAWTDAAEQFTTAARTFLDSAEHASASAPAVGEAAQAFADFLRDRFAELQMPWPTGIDAAAGHGAPPPVWGDLPAFGAGREHQLRFQRMADASRRLDESQRRLERLWSDALRDASAAFAARLASQPPAAPSAEALRALYDSWIDCAEDAYARMAHGEAFCSALADYVNASSQSRQELQASMEYLAKLLDLPTRSEINTLLQRVNSLEQRLRAASNEPGPKKPEPKKPAPDAPAPSRPRAKKKAARRAAKP